jgi:putative intracellular protease/amidase
MSSLSVRRHAMKKAGPKEGRPVDASVPTKDEALDAFREDPAGSYLTTDQGIRVPHTDDSLKAGRRGPTLLEDFHLREKITRFDHERIPERVVHARGSAAHGYFQVYESMAEYTRAAFLQDPSRRTPVFVRFSTVVGSRGSADTVRDVRGFATKFYTDEGNFDLVGNNIPVFFIQDGIKFPDFVHAVKPEADHFLAENGVRSPELAAVQKVLREEGATPEIVSSTLGVITGADGRPIKVDKALRTVSSVLYDAVFVPGGAGSIAALMAQTDAAPFVQEAFKHYKAIAAASEGVDFIVEACRPVAKSPKRQGTKSAKVASAEEPLVRPGVVTARDPSSLRDLARRFVTAMAQHRHWDRFDEERRPGK